LGETGGFDMIKPEPTLCPRLAQAEKLNREKEVIRHLSFFSSS